MKNIFILTALFMGLSFGVQAQKFGHIDAQSLLYSLPEIADIQLTIEATAKEYRAEIAEMEEDLYNKQVEYQSKAATWPDAIRTQKEKEIQALGQGLQEFGQTAQLDLSKLEESL